MASRDEIVAFTDELLQAAHLADYGPSGVQVVGAAEVTRVACGVSSSLELFRRAHELGAELLIVHHGLFWDGDSRVVDAKLRFRLEELFAGDINLIAYHLCLDAHPTIGNNALLADAIGVLRPREPFAEFGLAGELERPCPPTELAERLEEIVGRKPLVFDGGLDAIAHVAICSGSAANTIETAAAAGYECLITGEAREPTMMAARELGITFIAAGHYATETFGVKALAETVSKEFDLPWDFIELENPV